jgi:hypothetical protein
VTYTRPPKPSEALPKGAHVERWSSTRREWDDGFRVVAYADGYYMLRRPHAVPCVEFWRDVREQSYPTATAAQEAS